MGWSHCRSHTTKEDVVAELIQSHDRPKFHNECLAHFVRVEFDYIILWQVRQCTYRDGRPTVTYIACDLLAYGGPSFGWGYKPMDESMHPYYYNCPLEYLGMAPEVCPKWRRKVRQYHGVILPCDLQAALSGEEN